MVLMWAEKEVIMIKHTIAPIYDKNSRILILGSFPSVKSREQQFFMAISKTVFGKYLPGFWDMKCLRQLRRRRRCFWRIILLYGMWFRAVRLKLFRCQYSWGDSEWSVGNSCDADIRAIYTNGGKAFELYDKYIYPVNGIKAQKLPSTSPANAGYSLERLKEAWMEIVKNAYYVTVSAGIFVMCRDEKISTEDALSRADERLYEAKKHKTQMLIK